MAVSLPRILYLFSFLAWFLLLWPNPVTIFMAACFSCLTLPVYRRLRRKAGFWRKNLEKKSGGRFRPFLLRATSSFPILSYICIILSSLFVPIAVLVLLVSPQAATGLARLRELRANNFQIPPEWLEYFHSVRRLLGDYPRIEKAVMEGLANLDSLFTDAVGMLVSRSFGFVGSTMSLFWTIFLFLTLTILFTVYARTIRKIASRILHVPHLLLGRFMLAVHKALKAVMLGIVFVALIQGVMCGIAFAFAGVNQPAFWGMLATLVAPIPAVGTALVWGPLCLSLWFTGKSVAAIGLALWGTFAVAGIDNVLRPFFLRQGIKAPFFVLILAMLCGLSAFGAAGLMAGPILLALALQSEEEANRYYNII